MHDGGTDQHTTGLRAVLSSPWMFDFMQGLVGAEGFRRRYIRDFVKPASGARILDIGCGTGAILKHLPADVQYEGYDLSEKYIEYARRRFADRGRFHCERVSRLQFGEKHRFDLVLASGLLHHLNDDEAVDLFRAAASGLRPDGALHTYDNVYVEGQSLLARYFISRDRGRHVRTPEQYERLARTVFAEVQTVVRHGLLRIPYSHFFMTCSRPVDGV